MSVKKILSQVSIGFNYKNGLYINICYFDNPFVDEKIIHEAKISKEAESTEKETESTENDDKKEQKEESKPLKRKISQRS